MRRMQAGKQKRGFSPSILKAFRKRLQMTQDDLGVLLGYSHPSQRVWELENGVRRMSPRTRIILETIARKHGLQIINDVYLYQE